MAGSPGCGSRRDFNQGEGGFCLQASTALNTPPCKGHCWTQEEGVQETRALARQHLPCRWVGTGVWGTRREKEAASGCLCSPPSPISALPPQEVLPL